MLLSPFFLVSWLSAAVFAELVLHDGGFTPDHVLRVSLASVPSACETREDVVVNGTTPGPALRIPSGATTWIRVYNDMTAQNLTMHWHGLSQRFAPFSDGTIGASQWPIPPGHFFDYEIATEPDDSGTYFYHSHIGMQALSCAGPLIVEECSQPPYDYDDERILMFEDHFQKTDSDLMSGLSAVPFTWTGETLGITLNGRGVSRNQTAVQGPGGDANGFFGSRRVFTQSDLGSATDSLEGVVDDDHITPPTDCTLPVIDVEPGLTYRFRFIGSTGLSFISMGFEGHKDLTIVQVDGGEYSEPVPVEYIQLGGGQRFDVLFQAKTHEELRHDNKNSYFLQFETRDRPDPYTGYAVLRYNLSSAVPPAPSAPVVTLPAEANNWLEYTLQPLDRATSNFPTADEVSRRVILQAEEKIDPKSGRLVWELAHMSWSETSRDRPVLVDIYDRGQAAIPDQQAAEANYGWDPANRLYPAQRDEVVEIVIQNTGSQFSGALGMVETHPFHAHGAHFYDIGGGPGVYDAEANNAKLEELGYTPVRRDTTMVYRYGEGKTEPGQPAGWRAWRVRMEHPGVWMIHCHVLAHMIMGMETIWVVGDAEDIVTIPMTVSRNYFVYGGSVYGNDTHAPEVYHYFDGTNNSAFDDSDDDQQGWEEEGDVEGDKQDWEQEGDAEEYEYEDAELFGDGDEE
ncbi:Laccase-like multicopper oxidase 1 [Dichotomopilus funicola]|uniref:Laccase-like multicopper oxidase 1 n=1 Tax=Dichotomopilus funicola TaxID=1934379 RepID=A0AAN6V6D8_9PEZI|nr:Laccase-like multicopper oxidase 1 [Dichotomopilus funicola]